MLGGSTDSKAHQPGGCKQGPVGEKRAGSIFLPLHGNLLFSHNISTKLITATKIQGAEKGIDFDNSEKITALKIPCRGLLVWVNFVWECLNMTC